MVTERDRAMVEWIGRLGAAGAADVMARFGMGRTATYRRLAALVDQGCWPRSGCCTGSRRCTSRPREGLAVGAPGSP